MHTGAWQANKRVGPFEALDPRCELKGHRTREIGRDRGDWELRFALSSRACLCVGGPCALSGGLWDDTYDETGVRTCRKRVTAPTPADASSRAIACVKCGARFHAAHNYACRRHGGVWGGGRDCGDGGWSCCGSRDVDDPGCEVEAGHTMPRFEEL